MTLKTRKLLIICLNLIIVVFVCWTIYDEYRRVGKFQWVDPNAIEDHEELYLTPIFVIIAFLGSISILHEILDLKKASMQTSIRKIIISMFRWLSLLYGVFLIVVSLILILMTFGNIGNHNYERGFEFYVSLLFLNLTCIGLLGGLIIFNEIKKEQLKMAAIKNS